MSLALSTKEVSSFSALTGIMCSGDASCAAGGNVSGEIHFYAWPLHHSRTAPGIDQTDNSSSSEIYLHTREMADANSSRCGAA